MESSAAKAVLVLPHSDCADRVLSLVRASGVTTARVIAAKRRSTNLKEQLTANITSFRTTDEDLRVETGLVNFCASEFTFSFSSLN